MRRERIVLAVCAPYALICLQYHAPHLYQGLCETRQTTSMRFRDSRARALEVWIGFCRRAATFVCTLAAHIVWKIWAIEVGPGLRVVGWPIVRRRPGSTITIGRGCKFVSLRSANVAGLNRPCHICTLQPDAHIVIGDNSGFSATAIGAAQSITIGNNVFCGANVSITDTDWHNIPIHLRHTNRPAPSSPVVIEDDVWLCMNVTVLKGVRIGAGSVVAAGSVVSKDLPPGMICGGIPAVPLRPMTPEELGPGWIHPIGDNGRS